MTASIELLRCGDVSVSTNGVTWTVPRELSFDHDGFGQDAEWVAANFTNAIEIAAVDDISAVRGPSLLRSGVGGDAGNGVWTPDGARSSIGGWQGLAAKPNGAPQC